MRVRSSLSLSSITQLSIVLNSPKPLSKNPPKLSSKLRFFSQFSLQSSPCCAMAGESESFSTTTAEENVKFGFERSEMYQANLSGTVEPPYESHMFLCYKSHESWPPRVEDSDSDPLPKLLASALKARKNDIKIKTRFTVCEGFDGLTLSDGDVLFFPEMIVYRGLKDSDVDNFVENVLVSGTPWLSGVQEELSGSYVFVCAHNSRDKRCGVCGPKLIEKFKEVIESKDLKSQIYVTACSHVGGHKYAGNVIIFNADSAGKIAGNWYGYVTPDDVLELVDKQIGKGEVIDRIWRGQMGANVKEAEKVEEPKPANGTIQSNNEKQSQEIISEQKTESVGSCCQGANGFSCCSDDNAEKQTDTKKTGMCSWTGRWEQRHVLTTVAVVGAVATIAVAYGVYRKAR